MKKILFLLLFPLIGLAQITPLNYWQITGNSPTTNTTYIGTKNSRSLIFKTNATQRLKIDSIGNVKINGTVTVIGPTTFSGSTTYTGSVTTPTVYGSTAAGGSLYLFSNPTATPGTIQLGSGSGTLTIPNQTNINNTVSIGSSTAVGTSSLVQMYVTKGTSTVAIGEVSSGVWGIWGNRATPTPTNYFASGDNTGTAINDASGNGLNLRTAGATRMFLGSSTSSVLTNFNVSGTSTLTGGIVSPSINGSTGLNIGTYGNTNLSVAANAFVFTPFAGVSVSNPAFDLRTPANFSNTASTNRPAFQLTGTTRGWLTGNFSNQYEAYLTAPTYTAAGSSTITNAYGLFVEPPVGGTNMNIANSYGIGSSGSIFTSGNLIASGNLTVGSGRFLGTNAATLTTGNTGTVAVLSDAVFPVYLTGGGTNPADGATYYVGGVNVGYLWTANTSQIRLPYNCTLVAWDYNWVATPGSGETATVSINGTTNYTLSSSITYSNAAAAGTFTASGLSQNFNAGDTFNIKTVMPNWVTNPTGLIQGITLWFVRRQ